MGRWGDGEMGRWGDGEMGRCLLRVIIRTSYNCLPVKLRSLFLHPGIQKTCK
ncbi:hypothetical protein [Moorena producens]|uniref:hypothetical protein n=1 Tax=Moorena producens TaxID=1155739 RepID=UPI00131405A3|nr:hypothetical protein [Moorena producens]